VRLQERKIGWRKDSTRSKERQLERESPVSPTSLRWILFVLITFCSKIPRRLQEVAGHLDVVESKGLFHTPVDWL